jgi:hypothetical protein
MIPVSAVRLFVTGRFARELLNLTTSGRTPVQTTFRAQCGTRLATRLGKCHFATLAAEDDIPAMECRAAAQDRTLVQAAVGAYRRHSFLTALFTALNLAAETTDRNLRLGVVLVRDPDDFFLATADRQQ